VTGEDALRVAAYDFYESVYWTDPGTFKLTMRGQEGDPIYLPSGREIVETAHRFLAPSLTIACDPLFGTDLQRAQAQQFFTEFARRERFFGKFSANKRRGLVKGDSVWHIIADPEREAGSRVSIFTVDPAAYFPEENDDGEVIATHLIEIIGDAQGKPIISKISYVKTSGAGGPSPIAVIETTHPLDEWGQPNTDMPETILSTEFEDLLDLRITALPVYHLANFYDPEELGGWGSSEMRGLEVVLSAMNQSITDEELTLVLEGLGVYVTDAGAPIDEATGEEKPWVVAPARIMELPPGTNFSRVTGVMTVGPYQDHLRYLGSALDDATGMNDITRGTTDVAVAESGIALTIKMAPILARMAEKEITVSDVMTQMLFDMRSWFEAYEGIGLEDIRWVPQYGDRMPPNKAQIFQQIMQMLGTTPPTISTKEARRILSTIGWTFTEDGALEQEIVQEQTAVAQIQADVTGFRLQSELSSASSTAPIEG
jgi:hypothetical protein